MSIYKVKFRCINPDCNNIWVEDDPDPTRLKVCPDCSDKLRLYLYNDSIANIDDINIDEKNE